MALIIATAVVVALAITPEVDHVADARRGPGVTAIAHEFRPRSSALSGATTMQPLQAPRYADAAEGADGLGLAEPAEPLQPRAQVALLPSLRPPAAPRVVAPGSVADVLAAIAWCESRNIPTIVDPTGTYRGLFQFDIETWAGVGGVGDPAAASVEEQWLRAGILYERRGAAPWPVCGRN